MLGPVAACMRGLGVSVTQPAKASKAASSPQYHPLRRGLLLRFFLLLFRSMGSALIPPDSDKTATRPGHCARPWPGQSGLPDDATPPDLRDSSGSNCRQSPDTHPD